MPSFERPSSCWLSGRINWFKFASCKLLIAYKWLTAIWTDWGLYEKTVDRLPCDCAQPQDRRSRLCLLARCEVVLCLIMFFKGLVWAAFSDQHFTSDAIGPLFISTRIQSCPLVTKTIKLVYICLQLFTIAILIQLHDVHTFLFVEVPRVFMCVLRLCSCHIFLFSVAFEMGLTIFLQFLGFYRYGLSWF